MGAELINHLPDAEQELFFYTNVLLKNREEQCQRAYTMPEIACNSHVVMLGRLKELEANLIQDNHLENNILFTKIASLEQYIIGDF